MFNRYRFKKVNHVRWFSLPRSFLASFLFASGQVFHLPCSRSVHPLRFVQEPLSLHRFPHVCLRQSCVRFLLKTFRLPEREIKGMQPRSLSETEQISEHQRSIKRKNYKWSHRSSHHHSTIAFNSWFFCAIFFAVPIFFVAVFFGIFIILCIFQGGRFRSSFPAFLISKEIATLLF